MNTPVSTVRLGLAALLLAAATGFSQAHARVVGDGELENYCAEEAMVRLNVDRSAITTLPTELSKGNFYVNGEAMTGEGLVGFECRFGKNRALKGFKSNGSGNSAATAPAAPAGVPKPALDKCLETFGLPAKVKMVSPLKPGYYEIILRAKNGSRQVACTVFKTGEQIEDWVEMKP